MNGLLQLRGTEDLSDGRLGKRSIRGETQAERIHLSAERNQTGERIFGAAQLLREHDVRGLVPGEAGGVDAERALLRCRVRVVQSQIASDQIRTTVVVEVSHRKAVPPSTQRWQPG